MNLKSVSAILMLGIYLVNFNPLVSTASVEGVDENSRNIELLMADETGVIFELRTPEYSIVPLSTEDRTISALSVEGYGLTNDPGEPQLPFTNVLLGVPPNAQIQVNVLQADAITIDGPFSLSPAPAPLPWDGNPDSARWSYQADPDIYQQNTFIPYELAQVEDDGWLRDQRIVQVGVYPFQYQPSSGTILWYQYLLVEVRFLGDGSVEDLPEAYPGVDRFTNSFEQLLQLNLLNYVSARAWRTTGPDSIIPQTSVEGERLRIVVDTDGIYQITYGDLIAAGMAGTDPRTYQMFNQGMEIAIWVIGEEDGNLDPGDAVIFYGEQFRGDTMAEWYSDEDSNWITYTQQLSDGTTTLWHPEFNATILEKYADENVYWLQPVQNGSPSRMNWIDGTPGSAPVPATYRATSHAERQLRHWEFHNTSEDTWFWQFVADTNQRVYTTTLSAISPVPFTALVRSEYVGYYYNNFYSPDHHTSFWINNRVDPINNSYWDGRSRHRFEIGIPSTDLIEGTNQLRFRIIDDAYSPPWIAFDWFEIEYDRQFIAVDDMLIFPGENTGVWRYVLDGYTLDPILVFDITNPHQPNGVANVDSYAYGSLFRAEFQYDTPVNAQFIAQSLATFKTPISISWYVPPSLRSGSNGADYLIVSPPEFLSTSQTLAQYRANQGYRVSVVNIRDLYNEFNEGIENPIAIKNFLQFTFQNWTLPAPSYVVLIGDGNWDILGFNPSAYGSAPVFMPPNLGWVDPWQSEVDTSNLLANVVGDDLLPDVFIGRIPINTIQEYEAVIAKTIAFEQSLISDWQRNVTFIADNTPDEAGNFVAMANNIIQTRIEAGFTPIRIFEDDYTDYGMCGISPYPGGPSCPAVNQEIVATTNMTGTMFLNFIGHGSVMRWAHEQVFLYHPDDPSNPNDQYYSDFDFMTNDAQLPIVLSMDCLDGYWFHPTLQPSLAEMFLRTGGHGAVATFSPTGLGVATGHSSLMQGFYGSIFQGGEWQLGSASLAARIVLYNQGGFGEDLINTFTVFGDPAIHMPSPYSLELYPQNDSQDATAGTSVTYQLLVTNTGVLTDTFDVSVLDNLWVTTISTESLYLLPMESGTLTITVDIPSNVPGGAVDNATIMVRSQGDVSQQSSAILTTLANVYGMIVTPAQAEQIGLPGTPVTYTLQITNTSNVSDTFSVATIGNFWPSTPDRLIVGPIDPGGNSELLVRVDIPPDAADYASDALTMVLTSQADPNRVAIALLETTARTYGVGIDPDNLYGSGLRGASITYTQQVINTGGFEDSFIISAISNLGWTITVTPSQTGVLMPEETTNISVDIQIPLDAPAGTTDHSTVHALSTHDPLIADEGSIFTIVNVFGLTLIPDDDSLFGYMSGTVVYSITLTNLANVADTFDITINDAEWTTVANPSSILLGSGDSGVFIVSVAIPSDADIWDYDEVTIIASSQGDPGQVAQIGLTTTVVGSFIPLIYK